jgi:hypothetical protein
MAIAFDARGVYGFGIGHCYKLVICHLSFVICEREMTSKKTIIQPAFYWRKLG